MQEYSELSAVSSNWMNRYQYILYYLYADYSYSYCIIIIILCKQFVDIWFL